MGKKSRQNAELSPGKERSAPLIEKEKMIPKRELSPMIKVERVGQKTELSPSRTPPSSLGNELLNKPYITACKRQEH